MKKLKAFNTVAIVSLALSLIAFFLPFVQVKGFKSINGIQLIFSVFRRFSLAKTGDAYASYVFQSYSFPLLLGFLLFVIATITLLVYLIQNKEKFFNISLFGSIVAYILYGVQLSNSKTLITDFFGTLLVKQSSGGSSVYSLPDDAEGIGLGIGPKLLVLLPLVAIIPLIIAKVILYFDKNEKSGISSPLSIMLKQFTKNKLAVLGLAVLFIVVIFCFYGPAVFSKYAILQTDIDIAKSSPSLQFIFGTDKDGRDILTRLMYGGRISITVGFVGVLLEIVIGCIVGGISGYYGGKIDGLFMRLADIFLSLPYLPVVIILGAVMSDMKIDPQNRIYIVMLILGILGWPGLSRLVRGQILTLREQEYMVAAEALGIRDRRKIIRHLMPNAIPNVIVTATLDIGGMIIAEATLSFLGLGVAMPYPSWGNIIQAVQDPNDFALRPWLWIPAGVILLITVLCINFVGDGLRDAFDPKMKR